MTHLEYLLSLEHFGIKLGLHNITLLLERAGNPHHGLPCAHIGGTNGKGSTAAIVAAIARAAGYTVGRFTSPHLISVHERFIINATPISEEELNEQLAWFRPIAEAMETPPTFFEINTAIALRWFKQQKVDLAVIEVGMGGRLDSTNVITPVAAAITTIDMDHTQYLGDTLEKIAGEKAGIIKPGVPVIIGETKPGPRNVLLDRANELSAPVSLIDEDFRFELDGPPFEQTLAYRGRTLDIEPTALALAGHHQGHNAACALAIVEAIQKTFPAITKQAIVKGLAGVRWPGRLEKVIDIPPVIIDVAHNPAGAQAIASQLDRCITVLAVSSDKDAPAIIKALATITTTFIFTQFTGPRALPVDILAQIGENYPHHKTPSLEEAIELGLQLVDEKTPLLITGSFYTAGQARQILIQHHNVPPLTF